MGRTKRICIATAIAIGVGVIAVPAQTQIEHFPLRPMSLKAYARIMYLGQGANLHQWSCLNKVWTMESHWNFKATGSMTTLGRAYGIPQALPAKKMAIQSKDWRTNPYAQIQWGLRYIMHHWNNNACAALRNEHERGYY